MQYGLGSHSTGAWLHRVSGDLQIINEINTITEKAFRQNLSLYDCEKQVVEYLCSKYGKEYYDNNGEAIHYLMEDLYSSKARESEKIDRERAEGFYRTGY